MYTDLLTKIRNAQQVKKPLIKVPYSDMDLAVAEEMGAEDMGLSGGVEDVAGALTVAAPADQTLILNGAQIASAREIVSAVAAGELPRDTGLNMLEAFFRMTPAQAARVMASAGTTTPTTPNPRPGLDDPTQRGA